VSPSTGIYCSGNGNGNGNCRCAERQRQPQLSLCGTSKATATVATRNVKGNRNCRYAERQRQLQLSLRGTSRATAIVAARATANTTALAAGTPQKQGATFPRMKPPPSIPKLPSFLLQQILHIIRMFLFLRHDLHQHVLGRRIGIADTLDHLPIRLDGDPLLDQVGLDHRADIA
jgi:hypothetical protein